ncbi:MAG: hypothetical protein MH825_16230 [Cyanobacteria bacterium]|nr:hypothetical protein [Cyanobacteriota bacterium]
MAGRWIVVAIAVGLPLAIAGQNWQMTVALVVLGQSTLALPVGLWMAMAIAAGLVTSLLLGLLLGVGGRSRDRLDWSAKEKPTYVRQRSARQRSVESLAEEVWETADPPEGKSSRRSASAARSVPAADPESWDETAYEEAEADAIAREWAGEPRKRQPRRRRPDPAATAAAFEEEMAGWTEPDRPAKGWSADRSAPRDRDPDDLDWDEEALPETPQPRSPRPAPRPTPPPAPPVERSQRPIRQDRQGSVYSYSYREGDGPDDTAGDEAPPRTLIPPPPRDSNPPQPQPPEAIAPEPPDAPPLLDEGPNPEPLEPVRLPEPKRPPALDLPPPETRSRSVMDADYRVLRPPADPAGDRPNRRPADRTANGEDWDDWDDWDQPTGDRPEESW